MNVVEDAINRNDSFFNHPKLLELKDIGINSSKAEDALLIYLQLIEVQHWFDVEMVPIIEQQIVFLKGRKTYDATSIEYVLPLASSSQVNLTSLHSLIDLAVHHGCPSKSLLVAFFDSNSTVVYYYVTDGLVLPQKPSSKELIKQQMIPEWNEQQQKWKNVKKL